MRFWRGFAVPVLVAAFLSLMSAPAAAWVWLNQGKHPFPGGEATVIIHLFCRSGTCLDGLPQTEWQNAMRSALAQWNAAGSGFQFKERLRRSTDDPCRLSDAVAVILYEPGWACSSPTIDEQIIDALGLTGSLIILDPHPPRIYVSPLSSPNFLQRILLHEFGHVVGLGHPNQQGQQVEAVMNSTITYSHLQPDDIAGVRALYPAQAAVVGTLESPAPGAVVSGLGFLSGWKCRAQDITIRIDNGPPLAVAMGMPREDTRSVCGGETDNGFIVQTNWNWLGQGEHMAVASDNGVEFARNTFTVGTTGEEFLKGVTASVDVPNFPAPGETGRFVWNESTQHLELEEVLPDAQEPDPTPEPTTPASSVSHFNGTWQFTIQYTTDSNFCRSNSGQEVTCTVVNGLLSCPYQDKVQGTVSPDGVFSARDSENIRTLRGRLEGNSGSGTWENALSCDGTWAATKQSSFDHITRPTCSTLQGLEVEDYWGDPGRWDITVPCTPGGGFTNGLHIDIVPLSPEGFDVDAGDLLIVQGEERVTYDEDNPDRTKALIWVDRDTLTALPDTLDYRVSEAPYPTLVIAGRNTGLDFQHPFTVYYDDRLVAIFE